MTGRLSDRAARDVAFCRLLLLLLLLPLLVTLHALDLALTLAILRLPGTFERNPVAASLFARGSVYGALFKALGVVAGAALMVWAYGAMPSAWRQNCGTGRRLAALGRIV